MLADFRPWLLSVAQVPSRDGMIPPVPTAAQDHLSAELAGFFEGRPGYYAAVKARQVGWTTWMLLWSLWRASRDASYCAIWVAPHDKIAAEVLAKARAIATGCGLRLTRDNAEMCEVEGAGRIVWATIGGSVAVADVVGRAGTFAEAVLTEVGYPYEPDLVWVALDALRPALRRWRAPVMLDSTGNGQTGRGAPYYEMVSQIRRGELEGAAALAAWWMEPSYADPPAPGLAESLTAEEVEARARWGWTLAQVQWRRNARRDPRARARFAETYPESWADAFMERRDGASVLSEAAHAKHRGRAWPQPLRLPLGRLHADDPVAQVGGRSWLRAYAAPVAGRRYYAGLDCASGRARDAQGLVIIDDAGAVVAVARCYLEGPRLAALVARACEWYSAQALIEAQWAERVIPYLRGGVRLSEPGLPQAELDVLAGRWRWRWRVEATTGASRGSLWAAAVDLVEGGPALPDEALWIEAAGLVRGADDKVRAGGGGHDDLMMALALAATARARGAALAPAEPRHGAHKRLGGQRGERAGRSYLL